MKKFIPNLKYITFSLILIIASFVFARSAYADSYAYDCLDGGTITSTVSLGPPNTPYPATHPTTFKVSSYITSTCTTRTVSLTAENNQGPIWTIIPSQSIFQGSMVGPYDDTVNFVSPYNPGTYGVQFITTVSESLPITGYPVDARYGCGAPVVTYYSAYDPGVNDIAPGMDLWTDPQMQNVLPQGVYIQSAVDASKAYSLTNGHYIDSNGIHSTMVGNTLIPC